jgi:hypothetical protein
MLTATILDRRQVSMKLTWAAPAATGGGAVAGYDVRVAKAVITTANFDDTALTKAVTYTGTPAAPGQTDSVFVSGLNIEDSYYFAVIGKDAGGTRGTLMATTTAVQSQFMTTVLSGSGTDGIGQDVDGSGDFGRASDRSFTADGFSDLVVGAIGGSHVYVFFGSATGYAATPSITITGTTKDFGSSVVNAGDLDGDNLADIAVAAPNDGGGGKIYVFSRKSPPASWGTTNSWPATLTQAQANYVLTVDATFAGGAASIQPGGLARLGNFDGAGSDDLAVGLILHASQAGSLLVVKGSSTFASGTIPDPARTIEIDGTAGSFFGWPVVGIGQFFPTPAGPGLISSAAPSNVYAFRGQVASAALALAAADDSVIGPTADGYGLSLGFLGSLGGSPGSVSISAYSAATPYVDIHLGTAASGPFLGVAGGAPAATVRLTNSASGNSFGILNLGGGIKGTGQSVSLVGGDALPDLVVAGNEVGSPIYIINGASISSLGGSVNVSAAQTAVVAPIIKAANRLPSGWAGFGSASVIPHSNDDTYGDFVIGEFATGKAGRVVIFY